MIEIMIQEDYVSFEVAKLLNAKGFKGEFHKHYWGYEPGKEFLTDGSFDPEYDYPAPTLQMAMKWLREVHKIYIEIHLCIDGRCSTFQIASLKDDVVDAWDDAFMPNNISIEDLRFNTYQEAEEAAVKHCLENLI